MRHLAQNPPSTTSRSTAYSALPAVLCSRLLLALLLLLALRLPSALAQEEGELIRIEDLSRHELNRYIIEAEDQFYDVFNRQVDS